MEPYLSLTEISYRASMSTKFIRQHLSEIVHHRVSEKGKIWIRWSEFMAWMDTHRIVPGSEIAPLSSLSKHLQ